MALAIGLLVGEERERSKASIGGAGVRTFAPVALLGSIAALLPSVAAAFAFAGVTAMAALEYAFGHSEDPGHFPLPRAPRPC